MATKKKPTVMAFLEEDAQYSSAAASPPQDDDDDAVVKDAIAHLDEEAEDAAPSITAKMSGVKKTTTPPATKAGITKMTEVELDDLVAEHGYEIGQWDSLSVIDKKKALAKHLNLDKGAAKQHGINDPLQQMAQDIELLADQDAVEKEIDTLRQSEGMNDFRLGGLLQRLSELGKFDEAMSFKTYVSERFGIEYRKARYLIGNYNGLLVANVSWDIVSDLGWTKLSIIVPVLTPETAADWVAKAKSLNAVSLKAAVKAALEPAEGKTTPETPSTFKTKTFKVAPDQEEVINTAISDAQTRSGTTHTGVALEYICAEYIANVDVKKAPDQSKKLKEKIQEQEATIADLQAQLGQGLDGEELATVPVKAYLAALLAKHQKPMAALQELLGDAFTAVFGEIDIHVSIPDAWQAPDEQEE